MQTLRCRCSAVPRPTARCGSSPLLSPRLKLWPTCPLGPGRPHCRHPHGFPPLHAAMLTWTRCGPCRGPRTLRAGRRPPLHHPHRCCVLQELRIGLVINWRYDSTGHLPAAAVCGTHRTTIRIPRLKDLMKGSGGSTSIGSTPAALRHCHCFRLPVNCGHRDGRLRRPGARQAYAAKYVWRVPWSRVRIQIWFWCLSSCVHSLV